MKARECPFCGSTRLEIVPEKVLDKMVLKMSCLSCGATGPVNYQSDLKSKAIRLWNEREEEKDWTEVSIE